MRGALKVLHYTQGFEGPALMRGFVGPELNAALYMPCTIRRAAQA